MRIVLHIFQKDTRRLWPHILVTWCLLLALAREDRWRSDWLPGFVEGWLNLLLPLAWVCLVALAVEQEPLAGDRQFWITRPYRRPTLLAAKLLFVLAFIHAPSFLADAYILAARDFSPIANMPQLLWKQLLLAGALSLPALALASLVRSFAQFMLAVFAVAGGITFLAGGFPNSGPAWSVDQVRYGVIILVLSAAAAAIAWMQFFRRRTPVSRIAGVTAAIAAGTVALLMPPAYSYAIRSALTPLHTQPSIHLASRQQTPSPIWANFNENRVTVPLWIDVSGMPESDRFRLQLLKLEIVGADGQRYQTSSRSPYRPFEKMLVEAYFPRYERNEIHAPEWLIVRLDRSVYDRIKGGKVKLRGDAALTSFRLGNPTWMPVDGSGIVPGVGRCASITADNPYSGGYMLKVECESPTQFPPAARIRLWSPQLGREWKQRLGDMGTMVPGPRGVWLSPLDRRQTFFQFAYDPKGYGSQWLVPRDAVGTAKIAVTPEQVTGYAILHFEMPDLDLSTLVVNAK